MAHHFREPERRQAFLLPADMMDWLPAGDIVHLIVDAVAMMDLGKFETDYKLGRAGQAPFAPQVLLALLIYAYSHGLRSSRVIERLCGRDAGYRFIVGGAIPDHTVIARFRQRHVARMREVFVAVLRLCHEAGLVRLGLVALDGTKMGANAALDANRTVIPVGVKADPPLWRNAWTRLGRERRHGQVETYGNWYEPHRRAGDQDAGRGRGDGCAGGRPVRRAAWR